MPYLKVGKGGVVIAAESPTGKRIEAGEAFHASGKWYRQREGCAFLSTISADEYRTATDGEGPEPADDDVSDEGDPELPDPDGFKDLPLGEQKDIIKALDLQDECDLRSSESMEAAYADAYGQEG